MPLRHVAPLGISLHAERPLLPGQYGGLRLSDHHHANLDLDLDLDEHHQHVVFEHHDDLRRIVPLQVHHRPLGAHRQDLHLRLRLRKHRRPGVLRIRKHRTNLRLRSDLHQQFFFVEFVVVFVFIVFVFIVLVNVIHHLRSLRIDRRRQVPIPVLQRDMDPSGRRRILRHLPGNRQPGNVQWRDSMSVCPGRVRHDDHDDHDHDNNDHDNNDHDDDDILQHIYHHMQHRRMRRGEQP